MRTRTLALAGGLAGLAIAPWASAGTEGVLRHLPVPTVEQPIGFARPQIGTDGRTRVMYTTQVENDSSLHLTLCADLACSSGDSRLVDTAYNYFEPPAFLLRPNGRPLIATNGFATFTYALYDCGDQACSFRFATPVPGTTFSRVSGAAILSSGELAVLHEGGFGGPNQRDMMILGCGAEPSSCASGSASVLYDVTVGTNEFFIDTEIAASPTGGFVVATLRSLNGLNAQARYEIVSCASLPCTSPMPSLVSGPTATSYPMEVAIAVRADGRPLALDAQEGRRVLIDCLDAACAAHQAYPLPNTVAGTPVGIVVDRDGNASFGVWAPGEVGFFRCANPVCSSGQRLVTAASTTGFRAGKLATDANGSLAMTYVDPADRTLRLVTLDRSTVPLFEDGFEAP